MTPSTVPPSRPVGILGGMGPAAGADFVRLFVQACTDHMHEAGVPVRDQAFPEHWLVQAPVPDRSAALNDHEGRVPSPMPALSEALDHLQDVGACAVAMACNTAHAWHAELQARHPRVELLHVAREVAVHLHRQGVREVGLMATQGTYGTGLYDRALNECGIACHRPSEADRERLMQGIYDGVKTGDLALARECFVEVGRHLRQSHGPIALIMACTEIPLALEDAPEAAGWTLVNPAAVLARALAERAYRG